MSSPVFPLDSPQPLDGAAQAPDKLKGTEKKSGQSKIGRLSSAKSLDEPTLFSAVVKKINSLMYTKSPDLSPSEREIDAQPVDFPLSEGDKKTKGLSKDILLEEDEEDEEDIFAATDAVVEDDQLSEEDDLVSEEDDLVIEEDDLLSEEEAPFDTDDEEDIFTTPSSSPASAGLAPPPAAPLPPPPPAGLAPPPAAPLPPPAPAGLAPPHPPGTSLATVLAQINTMANALPSDISTQNILENMLLSLKNAGCQSIDVHPELESGAGGFQVEPFKLPESPDKVFYRIKVTYTIKAQDSSNNDILPVSFSRTISTNATNPEDAIKVASQFKETIRGLALKGAELGGDQFDDNFTQAAMSNRNFHFYFARNSAGKITTLESIQVASGNNFVKQTVNTDAQKKFIYDFKDSKYQEVDATAPKSDLLLGQVLADTEEEARLQKEGYSIKGNPDLYKELQENPDLFDLHIEEIKNEIKKKEAEFTSIKATFIQEPLLKWLQKSHSTKQVKGVLADAVAYQAVKKDKEVMDEELKKLSPRMQQFIESSQSLKDLRKKHNLDQRAYTGVELIVQHLEADPNYTLNETGLAKLKTALKFYSKGHEDRIDTSKPPLDEDNILNLRDIIAEKIEQSAQEIEEKENELASLETRISAEQGSFNEKLSRLHKLNRDLEAHMQYLEQLKSGAEIVKQTSMDKQEKTQAGSAIKTLDKEIKRLKSQITESNKIITRIMNKVEKFGNKIAADSPVLVAFDGPA